MARYPRIVALTAGLILLLAACGENPEESASVEPGPSPVPDAQAEDASPPGDDGPGEAAAATVAAGTTELGEVLVDADGLTLYLFVPDEQAESTCYDDCAANWPPLVVEGEPAAGEGADSALLDTVEREDGAMQVTYNGWPLYHWAGDEAAGDTNGQGVNEVWWVVSPSGESVRDGAPVSTDDGY